MTRFFRYLQLLTYPLSLLYLLLHKIDKSKKKRSVHRLPVPVISFGNITVGGTGKTPFVIEFAQAFKPWHPVILTRGYKSRIMENILTEKSPTEYLKDEPGVLATYSGCPVSIHPNRIQGGKLALERFPKTKLLILDDGFQHYRLERNFDIVLIDSLAPFGNGTLLPSGILREPIESLKRAHAIILTRSNLVKTTEIKSIMKRLDRLGIAKKMIFRSTIQSMGIYNSDGKKLNTRQLKKLITRPLIAFCGLGNPLSFELLIQHEFPQIKKPKFIRFPNHSPYSDAQIGRLKREAPENSWFLTTDKDYNKINGRLEDCYSLRIRNLTTDWNKLIDLVKEKI